ncbi:hypothetical protein N7530_005555 [Penicillium desertorum]|uniref:Uncharacterized protein n=1 Tax=Penicillium desertorum TaxID=1303715 RepID=A0A9W9X1G7_9EURO|nr:hypothetical protein N7530_005555 [Penicillium desertorum]
MSGIRPACYQDSTLSQVLRATRIDLHIHHRLAIDPLLVDDYSWWLEKAYEIFQEMVESGNHDPGAIPQLLSPATSCIPSMDQGFYNNPSLMVDTTLDAGCGFGLVLTSAEIAAMADSIEMYDAEWVSNAMMIHDIW